MDVVVRVGHRPVAPGVGHAGDGGRMANSCLMVTVIGAPEGVEFAEEVGLLVAVLGRAQPVDRVGSGTLANFQELVADLVDRLVPGNAGPLSVHQLGRVLQTPFAMRVLAHRGALGAVGPEIEGAVEARLLTDPDALVYFGHDRTANRTVGADRLDHFNFGLLVGRLRLCSAGHHASRSGRGDTARCQARTLQESPPIQGFSGFADEGCRRTGGHFYPVCLFAKHFLVLSVLIVKCFRQTPAYQSH